MNRTSAVEPTKLPSAPSPALPDYIDALTDRGPASAGEFLTLLRYAERVHRASAERYAAAAEVIKRCACGCAYTAHTWAALPYVGVMEDIELRNCTCGSTIAIELTGAQ